MALTLGTDAERLRLVIQNGMGWWAQLTNPSGPWEEGSAVALEFMDRRNVVTDRWEATREGDSFMFDVTAEATNERYEGEKVRLLYVADTSLAPLVWAVGEVSIHGD